MKKRVVKKGYTIEVVSWENDGDNYKTKSMTVDSKEEALAVKHMCENLFVSHHDDKTVANKYCEYGDREWYKCCEIVKNYLIENPVLANVAEDTDAEDAWDSVCNYAYSLMGDCEYYFTRVCETCTIYYSEVDVDLEVIED